MKKIVIFLCIILFTVGCDDLDLQVDEYSNSGIANIKTTTKQSEKSKKTTSKTVTTTATTATTTTTTTTSTTTKQASTRTKTVKKVSSTTQKTTKRTTTKSNENSRLPLKAICKDGTISYQNDASKSDYRGMCSHHGGIRTKLGRVR